MGSSNYSSVTSAMFICLTSVVIGCGKPSQGVGIDDGTDSSRRAKTPVVQPTEKKESVASAPVVQAPVVTQQPQQNLETTQQPAVANNTPPAKTYPAYNNPTQNQISDPTNATIYNYTQEGITSINGEGLGLVVPPGKSIVIPKRMIDINDNSQMYNLTVTTDSGRTGQAEFDPFEVDEQGWKASVSLNNQSQQLEIKQNAGGGGGNKQSPQLNNFL